MDLDYLKKVGIYILIALLSIGIIFYVGYHLYHSFTREVETTPAIESTLEDTLSVNSYLFMSEQVLTSPGAENGSIVPMVKDGENVKKTGTVAEIFSLSAPSIVSEIHEIDERIALLNSIADSESVSVKGSAQSESELYDLLSEIRGSGDNGNTSDISTLRSSFLMLLNKRNVLTRKDSIDISAEIEALQKKRSELRLTLGSLLDTIQTPVSGYYYSDADGYEDVFKAENLSEINYIELSKLLNSEPRPVKGTVCKLVTNVNWYLVCMLDESYKNAFTEGDSCDIHISEHDLTMDVYRVLTDPEGIALILVSDVMPEGFSFKRSNEIQIVLNNYKGLSVPSTAIRYINGDTGVYVLEGATIKFRRVEVLYNGETSYIMKENSNSDLEEGEIPWLSLNDAIITEGKGLYDGRVLGD